MMSDTADTACRRKCWLVSAFGAALIALLLKAFALFSFGAALFAGALFLVVFGNFMVWAFCTGRGQENASRQTPAAKAGYAAVRPVKAVETAPHPEPQPEAAASPAADMTATAPAPMVDAKPAPIAVASAIAKPAVRKSPVKSAPAMPAKPAAKPAADKPAVVKGPPKAAAAPRAAGLVEAMGRTKDDAPAPAATVFLPRPRGGKGDDLKQIKGVGPVLEKLLNEIGIWHFDQIAAWKARDIALVDARMEGFKGRISRDGWVKQARVLARGGTTEFSEPAAKGEVYRG